MTKIFGQYPFTRCSFAEICIKHGEDYCGYIDRLDKSVHGDDFDQYVLTDLEYAKLRVYVEASALEDLIAANDPNPTAADTDEQVKAKEVAWAIRRVKDKTRVCDN